MYYFSLFATRQFLLVFPGDRFTGIWILKRILARYPCNLHKGKKSRSFFNPFCSQRRFARHAFASRPRRVTQIPPCTPMNFHHDISWKTHLDLTSVSSFYSTINGNSASEDPRLVIETFKFSDYLILLLNFRVVVYKWR